MNGKDFKKLKTYKNVYCLVSTDSAMIDLYVERFKNGIKADQINFGYIKPYGKLFKKKTLNVLYMPSINIEIFKRPEYIFIYTDSIDKRSVVYKQFKDQIIELNNDYTEFIMNHSSMTEEQAKHFAKINNNDLGRIKSGLTIYNDSEMCYNRYTDFSSDIYGWIDAYIKKSKLPNIKESPISVMALLSNTCSNLLKVKNNDISEMNPYIKMCMQKLNPYITKEELISIIGDCFYLDCQIKKGLIDVNYVIDYLILRRT